MNILFFLVVIKINRICVSLMVCILLLQIFDFLKASVLKSYKDSQRQEDSQWIRELAPDSCDVAQYFLDTVYHRWGAFMV